MKIRATIDESRRTGGVTVIADRLEFELDTDEIARAAAAEAAEQLADAIRSSSTPAAAGTIKQRKRKGISSERAFYATGRLANGIHITKASDGSYEVSTPPDRLQDDRVFERFVTEVLTDAVQSDVEHATDIAVDKHASEAITIKRKR